MLCPARSRFPSPDSPSQNLPATGSYWPVPHILVLLSAEKEHDSKVSSRILLSVLLRQLRRTLTTRFSSTTGRLLLLQSRASVTSTRAEPARLLTRRTRGAAAGHGTKPAPQKQSNRVLQAGEHQLQLLSGCRPGARLIKLGRTVHISALA